MYMHVGRLSVISSHSHCHNYNLGLFFDFQKNETWFGNPSLVATQLRTSVQMSTYLAVFIVCDFEYLENKTKSGLPVRNLSKF